MTKKNEPHAALEVLIEKVADDVSELARAQRASADVQHASAHKLEDLSRDLKLDVAEIKEGAETLAAATKKNAA